MQWALKRFGKRKVFVLGHSWGSIMGLRLAAAHPGWLHAYIGMGQGTNVLESERRGWTWTLRGAEADRNSPAVEELRAIVPYADGVRPLTVAAILTQRKWVNHYGGAAWRRTGADFELAAMKFASEYTDNDVKDAFKGQPAVTERMLPAVLSTDLSGIRRLKTPLLLLLGRHDINVSSEVTAEWFVTVKTPFKRLIWFERSGHHVTSEEPGKLLNALVTHARPIAEVVGDVAANR